MPCLVGSWWQSRSSYPLDPKNGESFTNPCLARWSLWLLGGTYTQKEAEACRRTPRQARTLFTRPAPLPKPASSKAARKRRNVSLQVLCPATRLLILISVDLLCFWTLRGPRKVQGGKQQQVGLREERQGIGHPELTRKQCISTIISTRMQSVYIQCRKRTRRVGLQSLHIQVRWNFIAFTHRETHESAPAESSRLLQAAFACTSKAHVSSKFLPWSKLCVWLGFLLKKQADSLWCRMAEPSIAAACEWLALRLL
jgi:hypothetical protein